MECHFYKVCAMCGHVGRGKYVAITFAVKAENAHEAAKEVRTFPRVKHGRKDAILACEEIGKEEYAMIHERNNHDPYLACHSLREQSAITGFDQRIISMNKRPLERDKEDRKACANYRFRKGQLQLEEATDLIRLNKEALRLA